MIPASSSSSAIFAAIAAGDTAALQRLVRTADAQHVNAITSINKAVYTPLIRAAEVGDVDAVAILLAHPDINVNRPPGVPPSSPSALHRAAENGHAPVVALLLSHDGIQVNATAERGVTPLEKALYRRHEHIVQMLWPVVNDDSRDRCFDILLGSRQYDLAATLHRDRPRLWNCDLQIRGQLVLQTLAPYLCMDSVVALLVQDLPISVDSTNPSRLVDNPDHSLYSWMIFLDPELKVPDDVSKLAVIQRILDLELFAQVPRTHVVRRLMAAPDEHGRPAIDAADADVRAFLTNQLYFLGRYELLLDAPPVHVSATSVVVLAYDHGMYAQVFEEEAEGDVNDGYLLDLNGFCNCLRALAPLRATDDISDDATMHRWEAEFEMLDTDRDDVITRDEFLRYCDQTFGPHLKVAIKFIKSQADYDRECYHRQRLDLNFVLGLVPSPAELPDDFAQTMSQLPLSHLSHINMAEYANLVVMPAADRSLEDIFLKERPSEAQVIDMIKQVAAALDHLHSHRIVHGDLKKLNVLRMGVHLKLIDLDASTRIGDVLGAKFSSGILPPEMFYRRSDVPTTIQGNQTTPQYAVRASFPLESSATSSENTSATPPPKLPYELIPASPAVDMWALGCMLFQLLSGEELVPTDVNQDVTADYIDAAATWTDAKLHMRIHSQVPNEFAQNLLKQLLLVDPTARLSAAEVLAHPFLTGQRGKNHQAVLENVALVHQTQRNAQATLHALVDAHQNTEQLLEQLGHLTAQLSSLKQALLRGYFDAAEATVPTSFVVVRDRPSCVTSSDMDMLVASSATALLACVRSVALRTVHGSTITQALAVLTNGQPLYLYLVDEVSGEVVVGGDDGGMRRGGEGVYPIPIHPSDTSLLTSMLPLLVGGLKVLAHERRGRYVDNATRTWMEDALDMNDEEMGVRMFEDMACKDATSRHESVRGAALRRLKLWFLEKDPTESFAGLERVLVGDGQVRWTSHVNAQRIRRRQHERPHETNNWGSGGGSTDGGFYV